MLPCLARSAGRRIFSAWCQSDFAPEPSRDLKGPTAHLPARFPSISTSQPSFASFCFPFGPSFSRHFAVVVPVGTIAIAAATTLQVTRGPPQIGTAPSIPTTTGTWTWTWDRQWQQNPFHSKGKLAYLPDETKQIEPKMRSSPSATNLGLPSSPAAASSTRRRHLGVIGGARPAGLMLHWPTMWDASGPPLTPPPPGIDSVTKPDFEVNPDGCFLVLSMAWHWEAKC